MRIDALAQPQAVVFGGGEQGVGGRARAQESDSGGSNPRPIPFEADPIGTVRGITRVAGKLLFFVENCGRG